MEPVGFSESGSGAKCHGGMVPVCAESAPVQFPSASVFLGWDIGLIGDSGKLGVDSLAE